MFTLGHVYRRAELHRVFGGQQQGGISTPAKHKIILIFTSESGEQHGYQDGWTIDGRFFYTGEGQHGDMRFIRGNAAIRDHVEDGKELHMFEYTSKGCVQYLGEMTCSGFHYVNGSDTGKQKRRMIIFELDPVGTVHRPHPPASSRP